MKAKPKLLSTCLCILLSGCMLTACSDSSGTAGDAAAASDTSETEVENEGVLTLDSEDDIDTVYTLDYQNNISDMIEDQKSSQEYTIDDPLIIADPYGTNTTGLYVYFTTDAATELYYTVSADGYEDLLLEQVGDFTLQAGQHCVTYETSDELSDGQYYLTMYNNNNATISTRDYDYDSDENYDGTYSGTEGDESYYYKYLVDETAGTFTLVDSVPVTYSGYVSSVQQVGDNLLTDSGSAFEANEFDQDHNLIQTLTGSGATWWYRVFKYDYSGYWFA